MHTQLGRGSTRAGKVLIAVLSPLATLALALVGGGQALASAPPGVISTGTSAQVNSPMQVAPDGTAGLVFADSQNNRIRMVTG